MLVNFFGRIRQSFVCGQQRHFQVAIHQDRRHAEVLGIGHQAIFTGQIARDMGRVIEPDTEQILQRILILVAAHTPHQLPAACAGAFGGRLFEAGLQPIGEGCQFRGGQGGLILGRHFALIELIQHLVPKTGTLTLMQSGLERVDPKFALLLFRPVTGDAMLLNQWSNVFLKNCSRIRLPCGHALHAPHQNADADDPVAEWMKLKHGQIRRDPTGIQC